MPKMFGQHFRFPLSLSILLIILSNLISSCAITNPSTQTPTSPVEELVFADWEGDVPLHILDAFTAEYGINVRYYVYESQDEVIEKIREGETFDLFVVDSPLIPRLVSEGIVLPLNYQNIRNFKNISPNFRGLLYDPENEYCVPYSWGTTGLVVRTDLVEAPVRGWADLWDERYFGKVGIWEGLPREVIALTLKSLGYSANSEDTTELQAALEALIALKPGMHFLEEYDLANSAQAMASGEIVLSMGYSFDQLAGQALNPAIQYIFPEEGALLWGDTFVVPVTTRNQNVAETLLNFFLRPEISAQIADETGYATANEAAVPLIDASIRDNSYIFPSQDQLENGEIMLPLSEDGQRLYNQIWEQFLAAEPLR
jgi:spermidine/putrescine transport system substrate-binding protein